MISQTHKYGSDKAKLKPIIVKSEIMEMIMVNQRETVEDVSVSPVAPYPHNIFLMK